MILGARRRGRADSLRRRFSHRQNKCRRDEAERTGDEEGREIRRIFRTYQTSAIGSDVIERASGLADVFPNRRADEFLEAAA